MTYPTLTNSIGNKFSVHKDYDNTYSICVDDGNTNSTATDMMWCPCEGFKSALLAYKYMKQHLEMIF